MFTLIVVTSEIGDYEFLEIRSVVAKWVSKDPEEDKQICKN